MDVMIVRNIIKKH